MPAATWEHQNDTDLLLTHISECMVSHALLQAEIGDHSGGYCRQGMARLRGREVP